MGGFYWGSETGGAVCWISMSTNALALILYLIKVLCVATFVSSPFLRARPWAPTPFLVQARPSQVSPSVPCA